MDQSLSLSISLPYESDPKMDRRICAECGVKNVYTRIVCSEVRRSSTFLCFLCAEELIRRDSTFHPLCIDFQINRK
jgi:superfamily II helicase